jgi:hypothetical protein
LPADYVRHLFPGTGTGGCRRTYVRRALRISNVPYAPRATVLVRRAGSGGTAPVVRTLTASAERVPPGHTGHIRATFDVPAHSGPLELTAQLRDGHRLLDERTASITPTDTPALARRVSAFVTDHAITLVSILALLLVAIAAAGARRVRRLKAGLEAAAR